MPAYAEALVLVAPIALRNEAGSILPTLVPSKSASMIVFSFGEADADAAGTGVAEATWVATGAAEITAVARTRLARAKLERMRACVITASTFRGSPSWRVWLERRTKPVPRRAADLDAVSPASGPTARCSPETS